MAEPMVTLDDVLAALRGYDGRRAVNLAMRALQADATEKRRRGGPDVPLSDAALAATLWHIHETLLDRNPYRPPNCPAVPGPDELRWTWDTTLSQLRREDRRR